MSASGSENEQMPAAQVEPVDLSDQSIDEQLVQLVQAKLDGKIDEETYRRLVSLIAYVPAQHVSDASEALQYETPRKSESLIYSILKTVVAAVCLLLLCLILVSIFAVPRYRPRAAQARFNAARTDIANLETALDAFQIDNGRYPTSAEGLSALVSSPPALRSSWHGPYVKSVPLDSWGHTYAYVSPGTHHPNGYDLSSAGADGVAETVDDIANWEVQAR